MSILSYLEAKYEKFEQLFFFGLVGGFGTLLNTGILFLLTSLNMHYLLAASIATELAIISNFLGNHFITFRHSTNPSALWHKFVKFQVISIVTLVGTLFILWMFVTLFGEGLLLVWNLVAILVMFLVNFVLNKRYTWSY